MPANPLTIQPIDHENINRKANPPIVINELRNILSCQFAGQLPDAPIFYVAKSYAHPINHITAIIFVILRAPSNIFNFMNTVTLHSIKD